jgi:succinyl-diaminopimelate desuccinylase
MNSNNKVVKLLSELIQFKSVTPDTSDCQKYIDDYLSESNFKTEYKKYGSVKNMISTYGKGSPCLAFIGHTDVVPSGDEAQWESDPFVLTKKNDFLVGRGTSDMKGGISCFMQAVREFIKENDNFNGSIKLILTGDEEGDAINGIRKLVDSDVFKDNELDYCLVGEPSSSDKIGDVIRNGRRGSITGHLILHGIQGHVAYPEKAENPIHISSKIISDFLDIKFDNGNKYFPPTSFQISNINSGTGVDNVIPGNIKIAFNIRYSTETNHNEIKETIIKILNNSSAKYDITWKHSGEPYLTTNHEFIDICKDSIEEITNIKTLISTNGGTSDGRFMAKVCKQVVELGLTNRSIHKINECVKEDDLRTLVEIYKNILSKIFIKQ